MKQCRLPMQVAKHEELVSRLQSELGQSADDAEKRLAAVEKLETERNSLHDELKSLKDQVLFLPLPLPLPLPLSFSLFGLTVIFPGGPGLAGNRMTPFQILLELRVIEVVSGDNWSYKTCKAAVSSSPPTNQHPAFIQAVCPY